MSIIIHFAPTSSLLQTNNVQPAACIVKTESRLQMGPGLENDSSLSLMSADENSIVDIPERNNHLYSERHKMTITVDPRTLGSCFGLPYQDHNYGAPPPPTPPCRSPQLSPILSEPIVETETVSIVTTSEETHEASITRCVCGFEHDDEYMISCDQCFVWQHVDCMGLDRNKIPDTYLCEKCQPRKVDRQKAKNLQTKKKVAMTDESDDDKKHHHMENSPNKRYRTNRRKNDEDKDKSEVAPTRRPRVNSKHGKERMELKRSKFRTRRAKNKIEETCTADEEAQDAWKCSFDWMKKEDSLNNKYSHEVHQITASLMHQGNELRLAKQLLAQLCRVIDLGANHKKLIATSDLSRDQMIIEYKGQFLSSTQFHQKQHVFKQRTGPYILYHKLYSNEELCVDASESGNDARFVRRSCLPNAEIRHTIFNGRLHLYISSLKDIRKDEEITIPIDTDHNDSSQEVVCTCNSENCHLNSLKNGIFESSDRRRRCKKQPPSTDDDSNQSTVSVLTSPIKGTKNSTGRHSSGSQKVTASNHVSNSAEENDVKSHSDEVDEEHLKEQKKKMTREERKIDAIMRAFDQMEKAAKRRQMALDRMATQKHTHVPKTEEPAVVPEKKETFQPVKEEEKLPITPPVETSPVEEEKPSVVAVQTLKPKKGKRRRGSGNQSRRRVRTNSGGSDIFNTDDTSESQTQASLPIPPPVESPVNVASTASVSGSPSHNNTQTVTDRLPKGKRFLHEWLQEKVDTNLTPQCSIHTERSWSMAAATPTCYVRCTKDNPSSGGISAAHLRRSSIAGQGKQSSGQGSAKKRWLRQAMYDSEPIDVELVANESVSDVPSPLPGPCFSPQSQYEIGSPGISPQDDVLTPLKKRRLLRTSVESLSSPISPMADGKSLSGAVSPDNSSYEIMVDSSADSDNSVRGSVLESKSIVQVEKSNNMEKQENVDDAKNQNVTQDAISQDTSDVDEVQRSLPLLQSDNIEKNVAGCDLPEYNDKTIEEDSEKSVELKENLPSNEQLRDILAESCMEEIHKTEISETDEPVESDVAVDCDTPSQTYVENTPSLETDICPPGTECVESLSSTGLTEEGLSITEFTKEDICSTELPAECPSTTELLEESLFTAVSPAKCPSATELLEENLYTNVLLKDGSPTTELLKDCLPCAAELCKECPSTIELLEKCKLTTELPKECQPATEQLEKCPSAAGKMEESSTAKESKELPSETDMKECLIPPKTLTIEDIPLPITTVQDCESPMKLTPEHKSVVVKVKSKSRSFKEKFGALMAEVTMETAQKAEENVSGGCSDDAQTKLKMNAHTPPSIDSCKAVVNSPSTTHSIMSKTNNCLDNKDNTSALKTKIGAIPLPNTPYSSPEKRSHSFAMKRTASENVINAGLPLPASATCKRKVSLSEYRQRKRDNPNSTLVANDKKKSNNCVLEPIGTSETFSEKEIKLAALPLFENITGSSKAELNNSADDKKHRENLSERLRREFGLEDNNNEPENAAVAAKRQKLKMEPADIQPILSLCAQLPPPPPPPVGGVPQYPAYPVGPTYAQPNHYLVPQMAPNQYMQAPTAIGAQLIPVIHSMVTPPPPGLVPPSCTYTAAMHAAVPRPPQPAVYSSTVNSGHSYATPGAQRLPHPAYNSLYKPQVYK